jgi:ABC-2 type transport system permease protein
VATLETAVSSVPVSEVARGPRNWFRALSVMIRWELADLRMNVPLMIGIQVVVGAGFVLGISLFFKETPTPVAVFVSTGVPVVNILVVALVFRPQIVADQKLRNGYEFLLVLLTPKTAAAAAWYLMVLLVSIPGVAVSLWIAHLHYGISFHLSAELVAAFLLTAFTGTMMGDALAYGIRDPMTVRLVTQVAVFVMMGFSPILYPLSQMPGWLVAINWWLPFRHMAVMFRAALDPGLVTGVMASYVIVAIWGLACLVISILAIGRRR